MSNADEPSGEEAEAQREETLMPWIWGAIGVLVVAAFIALAALWPSLHPQPARPQMPPPGLPAPKAP